MHMIICIVISGNYLRYIQIASSFFYNTLCGEQDDGPMKPTIHGKNWIMLFSL